MDPATILNLITTYGIPILFALLAGWKTYQSTTARKDASLANDAVSILTQAIEIAGTPGVKQAVSTMSQGTAVGSLIDSHIPDLDTDSIRKLVRAAQAANAAK